MKRFLFVLLIFVLVGPMVARSQTPCPKAPPYALLRQDENYSYLQNPACRTDFWDPVKYVPLNSKGDRYLTLGGEIREWYEEFQNANWGEGPQDGNGYLLQRISLNSDWNLGRRIRFFGQLTSAIEAGRNGGPRPMIDEAKLWVEEGFADIALLKSEKASLTIRAGRQEFEFGSGRLVDVREGPNVRQAFDGIDMIWNSASWHVDGFATRPVLNNVNVFDDPPNHNTMFWGVYAVRPLPITKGGNIDLYYLGIDNKQATFERGTAQEIRHTIGTRFWGKRGSLDYNVEALLQLGSFGSADIRAWSVAPGAGYQLRSLPLSPQVEVRFIATSGDHPDTGTLATFNPLFPTAIYFGQGVVNLNGPSNLIGLRPAAKLQLAKNVSLVIDYDFFWRESLQDGVYGLGVNLLRSGLDNQARHIGSQPSVGIYWQLNRHFSLSAAYAHFSVGPFLTESATPGRNVNYIAIWATYEF